MLTCGCRGCESDDYFPPEPDCVYRNPFDFAVEQRVGFDRAAVFAEQMDEHAAATGYYPPTALAWRYGEGMAAPVVGPPERWSVPGRWSGVFAFPVRNGRQTTDIADRVR
jgi:hypothetical protein